jgi:predicted DNA-binding transcriptional regulator AlpA
MTKAYTINDFCKAYSISRSLFYKLKEQGKAPKTFTLGKRVLISSEAAESWQESLEA